MSNELRVKRGEVYYIHRYETSGSEQRTGRPAVIVSNNKANETSSVYEVCFLTLQKKPPLPTHVIIDEGICKDSTVLCEQITTVTEERLGDKMCELPETVMQRIDKSLLISLGLVAPPPPASFDLSAINEMTKLRERAERYEVLYNNLLDKVINR